MKKSRNLLFLLLSVGLLAGFIGCANESGGSGDSSSIYSLGAEFNISGTTYTVVRNDFEDPASVASSVYYSAAGLEETPAYKFINSEFGQNFVSKILELEKVSIIACAPEKIDIDNGETAVTLACFVINDVNGHIYGDVFFDWVFSALKDTFSSYSHWFGCSNVEDYNSKTIDEIMAYPPRECRISTAFGMRDTTFDTFAKKLTRSGKTVADIQTSPLEYAKALENLGVYKKFKDIENGAKSVTFTLDRNNDSDETIKSYTGDVNNASTTPFKRYEDAKMVKNKEGYVVPAYERSIKVKNNALVKGYKIRDPYFDETVLKIDIKENGTGSIEAHGTGKPGVKDGVKGCGDSTQPWHINSESWDGTTNDPLNPVFSDPTTTYNNYAELTFTSAGVPDIDGFLERWVTGFRTFEDESR